MPTVTCEADGCDRRITIEPLPRAMARVIDPPPNLCPIHEPKAE